MTSRNGWARAWAKERQVWEGRTWAWKLFGAMAILFALQAVVTDERWFGWLAGSGAVLNAIVAVVTYLASRRP